MSRLAIGIIFLMLSSSFLSSCEAENYGVDDDYKSTETGLVISNFSHVNALCQSMACYDKYLILISDRLYRITLFDMNKKEILHVETNNNYRDISFFHCNQCCFSNNKFSNTDVFPVLYVSQQSNDEKRCLLVGLRIESDRDEGGEIKTFTAKVAQIIYFPSYTDQNALGNVNAVIDTTSNKLITYSRNNNPNSPDYLKCRITEFDMPSLSQDTIRLENKDILNSYTIDCSAWYMQGAAIHDRKVFIAQGAPSQHNICIQVVDLDKKRLQQTYDLRKMNVGWEPEGCAFYRHSLYVYGERTLFEFPNIIQLSSKSAY